MIRKWLLALSQEQSNLDRFCTKSTSFKIKPSAERIKDFHQEWQRVSATGQALDQQLDQLLNIISLKNLEVT